MRGALSYGLLKLASSQNTSGRLPFVMATEDVYGFADSSRPYFSGLKTTPAVLVFGSTSLSGRFHLAQLSLSGLSCVTFCEVFQMLLQLQYRAA